MTRGDAGVIEVEMSNWVAPARKEQPGRPLTFATAYARNKGGGEDGFAPDPGRSNEAGASRPFSRATEAPGATGVETAKDGGVGTMTAQYKRPEWWTGTDRLLSSRPIRPSPIGREGLPALSRPAVGPLED